MDVGGVSEFLPEFAFGVAEGGGQLDGEDCVEIAAFAGFSFGEAAAADAELLAVFAAGRNSEFDDAIERGDRDIRAEHGFPGGDFEFVQNIRAFGAEIGMGGVADS